MRAEAYLVHLQSRGRYTFSIDDAFAEVDGSDLAVRRALLRLKKKGAVATPFRGFHVIVPPEYRSLGCLPPDQWVPDLMARLDEPYYAGLLTAAEFHGAAHQRPQAFQVVSPRPRTPLNCGRTRVHFVMRANTAVVPTTEVRTSRGLLRVSTPEATALDLVAYPHHAGGIDNVATVVAELAERIDPQRLAETAALIAETPVCQRLGYILDSVDARAVAEPLRACVARVARRAVRLAPSEPVSGHPVDPCWKVVVNAHLDPDL